MRRAHDPHRIPPRMLRILLLALLPLQDDPETQPPADDDPPIPREIPTTVVTPTGGDQPALEAPASTDVIAEEEIREQGYRTVPQALRNTPSVLVQETAHGHGSPYLRGFTSFRNLFLIDGIRLNNSVFRPGPNQYWNTVDPFSLDRLEVMMGPSSSLYGSDAIGGTVQALTRSPSVYPADGALHGSVSYRWAEAANYDQARLELGGYPNPDTGMLLGISGKDFDDVHGGDEVGLQPETGYEEFDFDLKIEHALDETTGLTFLHQSVNQEDVPRTHKTIFGTDWEGLDVGSELQRNLDQERRLTYLQLESVESEAGWYDDVRVGVSFHEQDEERDRIKGDGSQDFQGFEVDTLGLFTNFREYAGNHTWTYGFDYYRDEVDSFKSGDDPADAIQGPVADEATYDLFGLFVQDEIAVTERLDLIPGARWNFAAAKSDQVRDPVTDRAISIDEDWNELVGSLRFVYDLDRETTRLFGGVSQGFRAPNLSDLSRFDSARTDEFEIPSPDVEPEHTVTAELGVRRQERDTSYQAAVFVTAVEDLILRTPTGNTNADGEFEVTKKNVGDGEVVGLELAAAHRVTPEFTLFGNATLQDSEVSTFPTSDPVEVDEPLSRQMPTTVHLGLRWDHPAGKLWSEGLVTYADDADELSTRDESDTSRIPPGGTPGYTVLDLRAGYRPNPDWSFTVGLENVFDEDYRVHGSGLNRPGRNLTFGVIWSF